MLRERFQTPAMSDTTNPSGRDGGVDADAGLIRKSGGHKFPEIEGRRLFR